MVKIIKRYRDNGELWFIHSSLNDLNHGFSYSSNFYGTHLDYKGFYKMNTRIGFGVVEGAVWA